MTILYNTYLTLKFVYCSPSQDEPSHRLSWLKTALEPWDPPGPVTAGVSVLEQQSEGRSLGLSGLTRTAGRNPPGSRAGTCLGRLHGRDQAPLTTLADQSRLQHRLLWTLSGCKFLSFSVGHWDAQQPAWSQEDPWVLGGGSISAQPHPALGPGKESEQHWAGLCCGLAPSGGGEGRENTQASTARGSRSWWQLSVRPWCRDALFSELGKDWGHVNSVGCGAPGAGPAPLAGGPRRRPLGGRGLGQLSCSSSRIRQPRRHSGPSRGRFLPTVVAGSGGSWVRKGRGSRTCSGGRVTVRLRCGAGVLGPGVTRPGTPPCSQDGGRAVEPGHGVRALRTSRDQALF